MKNLSPVAGLENTGNFFKAMDNVIALFSISRRANARRKTLAKRDPVFKDELKMDADWLDEFLYNPSNR